MKIVVTGNIGCGKSTAVGFLRQQLTDYQLFDFDKMVAALYQDDVVKMQLDVAFGTHEKATISNLVHASTWQMDKLQAILNGSILAQTQIAFKKPEVILDIPLYYEKIESAIQPQQDLVVLCICANESSQVERVKARNGWTEEKIRSVMSKQWPQDQKALLCDYVISNVGTVDYLKEQVDGFILYLNGLRK